MNDKKHKDMANFDFQQTAQELQDFVNTVPEEIEQLRALYESLTQTGVTPVAAADWPVSDPQENVIYRVAGTSSYTDYMWNGTNFIPMATYDNVPTDIPAVGSIDVITAGGVANHGSAFDISEYNKNGATLATYADLSAALAAVPSTVQKGGMSIKFIQTSDNKYVQYRYMLTDVSTATTFTNVANWQGVDDVPTAGSNNLVKSGGVAKYLLNSKIYGTGSTPYKYRLDCLLAANKTYTLYLSTTDIAHTQMPSGATYILSLHAVLNDTTDVRVVGIRASSTVTPEYTFTAPQNVDYYYISGYADENFVFGFSITEKQVIKDNALQVYSPESIKIEEGSSSIYILDGSRFYTRVLYSYSFLDNTELADHLNVSTVTSPSGQTNCIEIASAYSLIYSYDDNVLKIVPRDNVTYRDIVLLACAGGKVVDIHKGLIVDYINNRANDVLRDNYKNVGLPLSNTYKKDGYFIGDDGTASASGNWSVIVYNNPPLGKFIANTYLRLNGESAKAVCVLIDKTVRTSMDYTVQNVISVSGVHTQYEKITETGYTGFTISDIEVTTNVKSVIICCYKNGYDSNKVGLFTKGNYDILLHSFGSNGFCAPVSFNEIGIPGTITSSVTFNVSGNRVPLVVTSLAKFETNQETKPIITLAYGEWSAEYTIGSDREYMVNQWRIPPISNIGYASITINPNGGTLYIKDFCVNYDDGSVKESTLIMESHLGLERYCGQNTANGFRFAAMCGYKYCITNPIVTSDGVIVCYHEDNTTLYAPESDTAIGLSAEQVHGMTYNQLLVYEIRQNGYVSKIPTLKEFLTICAQTGMHPVFSQHPLPTTAQLQEMKTMLAKLNLTDKLNVKTSTLSDLQAIYQVFGDTIESYSIYTSRGNISTIISTFDLQLSHAKKYIEIKNTSGITQSDVDQVIQAGFKCGIWDWYGIKGYYQKQLIDMGITVIVDTFNYSNGLNW